MEIKDVKKLLDYVVAADVNEFTYETGDVRVSVKRGVVQTAYTSAPAPTAAGVPMPATPTPVPEAEVATPAASAPADAAATGLKEVTAPIVGTFYSAPAPDAAPFVKVGDRVQAGAVLCIIEAMKLMNEIEAETSGTIAEVLVRNEEPVEYGQALFRIDPD